MGSHSGVMAVIWSVEKTRPHVSMPMRKPELLPVACLLLGLVCGCQRTPDSSEKKTVTAPLPATPDRLPPGPLLEGTKETLGLTLPKLMQVDAIFEDSAFAQGNVSLEDLTTYVSDRVEARHVEMLPGRIVFPSARVKGDGKRTIRIEILRADDTTKLVLRDITPQPAVPGLSEEERWKRAGMTPSGKLIDPHNLQ